jgi:putative peptidoglycan lipid II flippase
MYERGKFLPADTLATAGALQFYALGLLGYSVVRIASPAFYALEQNRIPVLISVITVLVNAGLNTLLVHSMGYEGLALGTSVAALLNAGLLLVMLSRHLGGLDGGRVLDSLVRIIVASAVMGLAATGLERLMAGLVPGSRLAPQVLRLGVSIGGAVAVLALAAHLLKIKEFGDGVAMVMRRFGRR